MEARYYERKDGAAQCFLCRHNCLVKPGKTGLCGVRFNKGGTLKTMTYGRPCSTAVDPIEKKPLFHFKPGSRAFSYATFGCNFHCAFCQNWQISQRTEGFERIDKRQPREMVELAIANNCDGIAHTYTEPTVFFEYAYDIAKIAHDKGLYNVFVTNGYTGDRPLKDIEPYLDAANIDLKGFDKEFYTKVCGAELSKVLDGIKAYAGLDIHLEITNLIIPGYNDEMESIRKLCTWIVENIGAQTPLHLSRYHPGYKLGASPTPIDTLRRARKVAEEEGLFHVYVGNVLSEDENTRCRRCDSVLIQRSGYTVSDNRIVDGRCPECGAKSHVVS